jgi:hypothetical protein
MGQAVWVGVARGKAIQRYVYIVMHISVYVY